MEHFDRLLKTFMRTVSEERPKRRNSQMPAPWSKVEAVKKVKKESFF